MRTLAIILIAIALGACAGHRPAPVPVVPDTVVRVDTVHVGLAGVAFARGQIIVEDAWGKKWAAPVYYGCIIVVEPNPTGERGAMPRITPMADPAAARVDPKLDDAACRDLYRRHTKDTSGSR